MCNLLAASASDIADMKRTYDAQTQNKGAAQMPFNALLMPEMANLQDSEDCCPYCMASTHMPFSSQRWPDSRMSSAFHHPCHTLHSMAPQLSMHVCMCLYTEHEAMG